MESEALDALLWEVLWQPLGLPRDIRRSFALEGDCIELAASKADGSLLGSLVANWTAASDVEIRHIAVAPRFQGLGIGRAIMRELEDLAKAQGCGNVELSVSLPSRGFYESLGYEILGDSAIDVGQGEQLDFWTAKKAL